MLLSKEPPQCVHCKAFGHSFNDCATRSRSEKELAEKKAKELLEVEAKKLNEEEKFDGSWNVVRRRRFQNMGYQGKPNSEFQSGGSTGGGKGYKQCSCQAKECECEFKWRGMKTSNKFEALSDVPVDCDLEIWEEQKKLVNYWRELKSKHPDHIKGQGSNNLLDYFYAHCDIQPKEPIGDGDDILCDPDRAPNFMKVDGS
ncbi:hypothetical protein L6452_01224 [Arctium lappa]|uniref:Uncharacterized protein n=1 Tax=Arctium lappa TaxID=4217 RepID=A0ACB9FH37_ARCLA|nr:hypothetical protein L6452_01224 [Arctium lappa]